MKVSLTTLPPMLLLLSLLTQAATCPAPGTAADRVPFQTIRGLPMITVCVNDQGPFAFLVDTGTESTMVDIRLAVQLRLILIDRVRLQTPQGSHPVGRSVATTVSVGPKTVASVELLVDRLDDLHSLNPGVRGILGQNFLVHFEFVLDFRHRRLEFHQDRDLASPSARIPFELKDGRMLVAAKLGAGSKFFSNRPQDREPEFNDPEFRDKDARIVHLQFDSGSTHLLLFDSGDWAFAGCPDHREQRGLLTTHGDQRTVKMMCIGAMQIGSILIHDIVAGLTLPLGSPGKNSARAPGIDGLLPASFFDKVYFNFSEGYIAVSPVR